MNQTLAMIEELVRIPAPCPAPMGLACDGTDLWIGSFETNRIYGLNAQQGTVFEEAAAPGRPYGLTVTGDALRVVVGDAESGGPDDRFIRRYIMGKDFKSERIPCPEHTGSFLAYDGDRLYLSQRDNKVILELDEAGRVLRTIAVPRQITGMVVVGGKFYLVTTESREIDDYRLLCIDARKEQPDVVELATIPFGARSLGFDGTKFWTNCRAENTIVAFAKPA
jgi:outer membrane protein assembly factor BamB